MIYAVQGHAKIMAETQDKLARRAAVLAENAARVFDNSALIMDMIDRRLDHLGTTRLNATTELLADYAGRSPAVSSIMVLSPEGDVLLASVDQPSPGFNNADREYFQAAKAKSGLVISNRIVGNVTKKSVFVLSREIADGRVAAIALTTRYFEDLFSTMSGQDGLDGVVTLYREDGRQLVRYPVLEHPVHLTASDPGLMHHIGTDAGSYTVVPKRSRKERMFAFNRVPGYPVYVTYGVDVHAALEPWLKDVAVGGLLAALAAMLLAGFSMLAVRRIERADRNEVVLQRRVADRTAEALCAIEDRERALRDAEMAHNAKAHFLAAASHDLRQPIQALRLFLDVLDGRMRSAEDHHVVELASKALKGAEDLLAALLDVSTLDAGMVAPSLGPVVLRSILDGLAAEVRTQSAARGIEFRYVPCTAWVLTDPVLLSRMLRNLLANALRYTDQGAILFGCRREGDRMRVEVWDTGPGIPADKLESVFEDFVQLGNLERDRTKGLGLGLAVVRRMAVLLGHRVSVQSSVGKGTVFCITLDKCPPSAPEESRGAEAEILPA